ncbi:probable anion transporter 3, chloroplastic isoform X2 [Cryptomeria japonica]|uniref:probable anion transporter 3, chloroplastic isoform X2 n=1 Tax=Cryptomeria japonica TaxID=3369 RepID=UPI0025ACE3BA|nr:probable anion transporter 3, chloroplastic isoform X2 [Cryptomeria japonica]
MVGAPHSLELFRWFPRTERARAVGLSMSGFHLGSVIGLITSPIIMAQTGVFGPFVIFGISGFLWLLVWVTAISRSPQYHSQISKSELSYILKGNENSMNIGTEKMPKSSGRLPPFGLLLSKLPTWTIIVANAMNNWGYFIILSWMPIYFKTIYGVNLKQAAWFSAIPWAMMAALGYVAGAFSDNLIQSGFTVTFVRKLMQSIGFLVPAVALIGLNSAKNPSIASAWLTAAVGFTAFSQAGFLVNLQEIAPQYSGVLHGMSNTAGTLAAIIGTVGTGYFVEWMGSFQGFLTFTAVLYFICTIFWDLCATGERII